jgi:hypothetical protein
MAKSQTLDDREFSLEDGERYFLVVHIGDIEHVLTRDFKGKPVLSSDFNKAKTFKNLSSLDRTIETILEPNEYRYSICQVKDVFEPRYFIRLKDPVILIDVASPRLTCYRAWYVKGDKPNDTYTDREQAQKILDKYKLILLQFYHKKIMELKDFKLD